MHSTSNAELIRRVGVGLSLARGCSGWPFLLITHLDFDVEMLANDGMTLHNSAALLPCCIVRIHLNIS